MTAVVQDFTEYLTFKLDNETYAIEIAKVREVLDYTEPTKVPNTPAFMRGVINVRGGAIPVVDLRLKFGLSRTEKTLNTCIIITEVLVDGEPTILGALADSVQEVLVLETEQIGPAPKIGTRLDTRVIKGMGKQNDKFIIILDIDMVFSSDDLILSQVSGTAAATV